jgi:hypothetical protein
MNRLIIIIVISYILYFIQLHLLYQNTYAVLPILKNGYLDILVNSSSAYIPNIPYHSQNKNEITETISQIHSSPDRYIPPPPLPPSPPLSVSPSINSIPQQSHNASNIYANPNPSVPQKSNITPDRYIPPPPSSSAMFQQQQQQQQQQQFSHNISNFTMFDPIIQNISSSLYTQINSDIDEGKTLFSSLHDFCTFPLIHYACNVNINNLTSNYNFDKIKTISSIAKSSLDDYKKNPTILAEQRFKQANLNLTNCLSVLSLNTQNQLHSLLGSQLEKTVQKIIGTLKVNDLVLAVIHDFVKVGTINEKLGIRPDPLLNKCA